MPTEINRPEINLTVLDFYAADAIEGADGTLTYGTPAILGGSAEVGVVFTKNPIKVHESGRAIHNKTHVADAKVTLNSHTVPLAQRMDLFYGATADAQGGYMTGGDQDTPRRKAIGWPVLIEGGRYLCTWFFDASAAPPDESYKTSDDQGPKIEPSAIEFSCVRRPNDRALRYSRICESETAMKAFFATVPTIPVTAP